MHLIDTLFRKHWDRTILAVCILFSLTLLALPKSLRFDMAHNLLAVVLEPWGRATGFFSDLMSLREENRRMKRMLASLLLEREKLLQFRAERSRLRRMAAFKEDQFFRLLPCEVIGQELDRYQGTLMVDKGARDSIKVGMPALSYQGYIGRVSRVRSTVAWIQLISSRNTAVSCLDKRSRVVGILERGWGLGFRLKNVDKDSDVRVGDTLITSGYGGAVPKGFPIAVVSRVGLAIDGVTKEVEARSIVRFDTLEEVFIMVGWLPWEKGLSYDAADEKILQEVRDEGR